MTITQLEYIIAVDTYRHFSLAAEHCYVTQPTLSMQIQKLEDDLDVKIFDRSKQPVIPTEIGEEIIKQARVVVHEARMLVQMVKDKRGTLQGELRIGIIPTLAPYLLPVFLQQFLSRYPDIKLRVKEMTTEVIIDKLKAGRIDAGLLVTPLQDNSIIEHPLFYEELIAYVSKSNAAYKKTYMLPDDIDLKELWLLEEGHCFRSQTMNLCELKKQNKEHSHFEYEAGSIETLRKMVEMHHGITILPEMATFDFTTKQQNMIRHFKAPAPVREVSLVTHRNYVKKKLVDVLKAEIAAALPEKILRNKKENVVKL
ncbi:MAG TPA: LysR substrate-binding domain-containing protein [Ferruginibacter sp.]|nr:LysR substrate-binding domain-containing protein [Ferruginibacter sp.]HMP21013.1 LysR substrate-binding domain-containing protein [Ferruginibacter sp.]